MFPSNPRSWSLPAPTDTEDIAGRRHKRRTGFGPIFFHAPYLVNLASADSQIQKKSLEVLRFALRRAARCGAEGVVVHAGSHGQMSRRAGLAQVAAHTRTLLGESRSSNIIFELTAGGGAPIASLPGHANQLVKAIGRSKRVRFCLDTQHLFAAGLAWHARGGVTHLLSEIQSAIGLERVACLHVNDSATPFASHHDRHEILGHGQIGISPFRRLLANKEFSGIPLILETPGALEDHASEVSLLRAMVAAR